MTKIGSCKMVVEPHIFDVTLFVIKDMTAPIPQNQGTPQYHTYGSPATPGQHVQQHHHQMPYQGNAYAGPMSKPLYPAPNSVAPGPPQPRPIHHNVPPAANPKHYNPPSSTPTSVHPAPTSAVQPTSTLPKPNNALPPTSKTASQPPVKASNINPTANSSRTPASQAAPVSQPAAKTSSISSSSSARPPPATKQPPPPSSGAPDPVIQMLAQRAQNDHALKQVMKLVASGQADQAQLNYFQGHIDELTKLVKQQQEDAKKQKAQAKQHQQQRPLQQNQNGVTGPKYSQPIQPTAQPYGQPPGVAQNMHGYNSPNPRMAAPAYQQPRPMYHSPAVPVQPRPPRQVFVPPPLHVLLEFSQNSADRFLFPKNSILEFDAKGTTLLASFLVVKKASQLLATPATETKRAKKADAKGKAKADPNATPASETNGGAPASVKREAAEASTSTVVIKNTIPDKEYYQPVTVRFECPTDGSVFNALSRVVAPVEQVQKYMLEVASKAEHIPPSFLAMRLPRESKEISIVTQKPEDVAPS
jgi:hypothetical protein